VIGRQHLSFVSAPPTSFPTLHTSAAIFHLSEK
jgi:hypothetical protein